MYQPPSNQPDPNQSFYNGQTSQYPQQPSSYPQQSPLYPQPGQYSQQPYYNNQQSPIPQPKKRMTFRERSAHNRATMNRKQKILYGCVIPFVAVLVCGLCVTTSNAMSSHQQTVAQQPTAASTHTIAEAAIKPTSTATRPTPTSIPKPTATPQQPTPRPTVAPAVVVAPTRPPAPPPTQVPAPPTQPPAPPACTGIVDGGVCYSTDSTGGTAASTVPADFCSLVACVSTFWKDANGSVVLCANGKYSHSGGVSGACSRDGGVSGPLYRH